MKLLKEHLVTYIGRTTHRNRLRPFGIKRADRRSHMYIIGKTATGKSTLLETLVKQDIWRGEGLALIDPHGDLVERVASTIPSHRTSDVIWFDVPSGSQPYGYNPLKYVRPQLRPLAASGLMEVFKKLWPDAWGVRMEHLLRNTVLALLDVPDSTLADIPRLLIDKSYRLAATAEIQNDQVRRFWESEFGAYSTRYRADSIAPILNKAGAFLADPVLFKVLTAPERPLHLRRVMDERKVLLVNLSKGKLGEDSAALLGALLMTTLGLAAFSRAEKPPHDRALFYIYADEFQTFTTLAVANMIAELRKYGVALVLGHQYLHQLSSDVRHAVLGNAGSLISFRLGAEDAAYVTKELQPRFSSTDLISLPNHNVYVKLLVDGDPTRPFSAVTIPPEEVQNGRDPRNATQS